MTMVAFALHTCVVSPGDVRRVSRLRVSMRGVGGVEPRFPRGLPTLLLHPMAAALSEATPSVGLRRAFGLSIDSRRRHRRVALDR